MAGYKQGESSQANMNFETRHDNGDSKEEKGKCKPNRNRKKKTFVVPVNNRNKTKRRSKEGEFESLTPRPVAKVCSLGISSSSSSRILAYIMQR